MMWGQGANGQERILETFLVQEGAFVIAQGQELWPERAALGLRGVDSGLLSGGIGRMKSLRNRYLLKVRFIGLRKLAIVQIRLPFIIW